MRPANSVVAMSHAAAFATRGCHVLSDDVVRIVDREDAVLAYPGHPRLTVWPESAAALFGSPEALPRLTPTYDKRYLTLEGAYRFQRTPVPIDILYVLGDRGPAPHGTRVRALTPQAALMTLVRHTYGNYLLDGAMRGHEFDLLSRVAGRIPLAEVSFEDDILRLPVHVRS